MKTSLLSYGTVLCKSNESEMREFRSLSSRTFDVLSVISLRHRAKIRSIFETIAKIHYQKRNFACSPRNIAVQCAGIERIEGPFPNNRGRLRTLLKYFAKT